MGRWDTAATPDWTVQFLFEAWRPPRGNRWIDPCAGTGALMRACLQFRRRVRWTALDIRPECQEQMTASFGEAGGRARIADALDVAGEIPTEGRYRGWDFAILHPPRNEDGPVRAAMRLSPTVAALVPMTFVAHRFRYPWLMHRMPDLYVLPTPIVLPPLPDADPSASMDVGVPHMWIIWEKRRRPRPARWTLLSALAWGERKRRYDSI